MYGFNFDLSWSTGQKAQDIWLPKTSDKAVWRVLIISFFAFLVHIPGTWLIWLFRCYDDDDDDSKTMTLVTDAAALPNLFVQTLHGSAVESTEQAAQQFTCDPL